MLVMATFAAYLAVVVPDLIVNLFIGAFVLYLVGTAWMTVRRREGTSCLFSKFIATKFECDIMDCQATLVVGTHQ